MECFGGLDVSLKETAVCVVALTYRAAVDVLTCFTRPKAAGAHFGLVRTDFYEAVSLMLSRIVGFSELKTWALRVA